MRRDLSQERKKERMMTVIIGKLGG